MKKIRQLSLAAAISAVCATPVIAADAASITEALKDGDVTLSLRLRYEDVTQEVIGGEDKTGDLLSLKTRLTFVSKDFNGLGLGLEMDDVSHITEYDTNGAAILDPAGTEVNQYYLTYKLGKSVAKYGRQRILLDNQRFVGGVGFRQNEQTYDGFSITSNDVDKLTLFGAYITNVNRIFGEQAALAAQQDNHGQIALLNANYKFMPEFNLTGYYYGIDNETVAAFSTTTTGLRATGAIAAFGYSAEYASQSDAGDNKANYSASYFNLEGTYSLKPVKFTLGHEVLGADGTNGQFITPLATLHAFQGWTDMFLGGGSGNVKGGIADTYFTVAGQAGPVKLVGSYHSMSPDDETAAGLKEGEGYGDEIGFLVAGSVAGVGLSAKYAVFSPDSDGAGDVSKLWLTAEVSF